MIDLKKMNCIGNTVQCKQDGLQLPNNKTIKMEKIKHPELNDYFVSETGEIYDKDKKKIKEYKKNGYYNI